MMGWERVRVADCALGDDAREYRSGAADGNRKLFVVFFVRKAEPCVSKRFSWCRICQTSAPPRPRRRPLVPRPRRRRRRQGEMPPRRPRCARPLAGVFARWAALLTPWCNAALQPPPPPAAPAQPPPPPPPPAPAPADGPPPPPPPPPAAEASAVRAKTDTKTAQHVLTAFLRAGARPGRLAGRH